jgi:hypothetical protein
VAFQWRSATSTTQLEKPGIDLLRPNLPWKRRYRSGALLLLATAVLLGTFLAAVLYKHAQKQDIVRKVWSALLDSNKPVLICIAQPLAYLPSLSNLNATPSGGYVPLPDAFVGVGDAYA